jgi:DNA replication factor GINS
MQPPDDDGTIGDPSDDAAAEEDPERTTVRIKRDVGSILGVDEREYDLESEDVVRLPSSNAEPLLARDAAERIE